MGRKAIWTRLVGFVKTGWRLTQSDSKKLDGKLLAAIIVFTSVVFNQGSATPRGSAKVLQGVIQLKKGK